LTLVPLSAWLDAELAEILPGIQGVVYGVAIIAVTLLAPEGIFWKLRDLFVRWRSRTDAADAANAAAPSTTPAQASAAAAANTAGQPTASGPGGATGPSGASGPGGASGPAGTSGPRVDFAPASAAGGPIILEARGLSKAYGGLKAVNGVDLAVRRGEILGIIGPNGAGKTTLFNLLNGFVAADSGEILLNGERIDGMRPNRICRRGVGRSFQVVKPFRRMSIADNVIVGAYVRAATLGEARAVAAAALAEVGLSDAATQLAGGASNKQLRLMELARALASRPSLLLLDEVFAGLSAAEVEELVVVIRAVARLGITIVIIEHTMQAMVQLVDRFVVLDHGAVLAEGPPAEITSNPKVIEAYLGRKWLADA
jgi:branched-chain amino acid transport system permease protein